MQDASLTQFQMDTNWRIYSSSFTIVISHVMVFHRHGDRSPLYNYYEGLPKSRAETKTWRSLVRLSFSNRDSQLGSLKLRNRQVIPRQHRHLQSEWVPRHLPLHAQKHSCWRWWHHWCWWWYLWTVILCRHAGDEKSGQDHCMSLSLVWNGVVESLSRRNWIYSGTTQCRMAPLDSLLTDTRFLIMARWPAVLSCQPSVSSMSFTNSIYALLLFRLF